MAKKNEFTLALSVETVPWLSFPKKSRNQMIKCERFVKEASPVAFRAAGGSFLEEA